MIFLALLIPLALGLLFFDSSNGDDIDRDDRILGTTPNDALYGTGEDDVIRSGTGNDWLLLEGRDLGYGDAQLRLNGEIYANLQGAEGGVELSDITLAHVEQI